MIHGGVVTRSRKENKANVERKVGNCWQWQATGQCSKGDSCGFHHGVRASGNGSELHEQKERTSSLAPNSKATKDRKGTSSDEKDGKSFDKRNKIPCQWRNCTNPSCSYRHPPECQNYISQIGCRYGKTCFFFDMLSWRKSPTRSRRKEVRMDQLQVREAHLSSDKVSADQTSDNINAEDNTMSPYWHLWRSRHLEKATRCCQAKRLISLVRSAWFRPILDWLWRKSKSDCFRRSHLTSDKVNADQYIGEGQCWG